MYRILVADDEAIIREGIKCLFDYEALGFTVCAEAATGDEAYEKMMTLEPDVVLMDIRMPGLSGLEAVSRARQEGFGGKVVIVSSYADFQYAKEAIRCDVQHYITKPIDEDELQQIFLEFRQSFEQDQKSRKYFQKARDAVIEEILSGGSAQAQFPKEIGLDGECYKVAVMSPFHPGDLAAAAAAHELLRLTAVASSSFEIMPLAGNQVVLLKSDEAIEKFHLLLDRYLQNRELPYPPPSPIDTLFITYGSRVDTLDTVSFSYHVARQLQERRFFCAEQQHILGCEHWNEDGAPQPVLNAQLLDHYTDTLLKYIQTFNRNMIAATLQDLQERISSGSDSIDSIRLFFTDLYLRIKEQMSRLYAGNEPPFYTNSHIIQTFQQAQSLHEIIFFLTQQFNMIMSAIGTSSRDSVLDDVLHYIQHNYASNITLESIAPLFGYNHSYLGKIFRKKMDCSFNVYVDHVRIEKAKELLLQDDAKVYTIAERVGYKNVDYFHVKFRKYVNQSPAEFRKNSK